MRIRALSVITLLVALLAGCGGDDGGEAADEAPATDQATEAPAADEPGGSAGGAEVVAEDIAFDPNQIEVSAGDAVTWENRDSVAHTVTAGTPDEPGDAFDEPLPTGGTIEITFDEPGTQPYFCTIHPSMTGEVVVS